MKQVEIFTDGACSGNPGPGGWGAVLRYNGHEKEISGGEANTTNNRMELSAVINALALLKEPCKVTLYSDSQYVCNALKLGWAKKWKANNWMRNKKEKALNPELWDRLLTLYDTHEVENCVGKRTRRSSRKRALRPTCRCSRKNNLHNNKLI